MGNISICGFEYHGPRGYIAFSPRLSPEDFKAAFISAEGWGAFSQTRQSDTQTECIRLHWGMLTLKEMAFDLPSGKTAQKVQFMARGQISEISYRMAQNRVIISLAQPVKCLAGQDVQIKVEW